MDFVLEQPGGLAPRRGGRCSLPDGAEIVEAIGVLATALKGMSAACTLFEEALKGLGWPVLSFATGTATFPAAGTGAEELCEWPGTHGCHAHAAHAQGAGRQAPPGRRGPSPPSQRRPWRSRLLLPTGAFPASGGGVEALRG
jgi:hypothetical protein